MEKNNLYKIEGVIYAKPIRKIEKDGKEYTFTSIILEVKRTYNKKNSSGIEEPHTITTLPEFHFGYGVSDDGFNVKDHVNITFSLQGKKVNASWHKTEATILYINHADIQTKEGATQGEIKARDVKTPDNVFVGANPLTDDEGMEEEDLPF